MEIIDSMDMMMTEPMNTDRNEDIRSPLSDNDDELINHQEQSFPTPESTSPAVLNDERQQQQISEKLETIADSKLRDIISNQIDLEIRLKHRECELVVDEMSKCESQLIALRKYYNIAPDKRLIREPIDFTAKYSNLLAQSFNFNTSNIQGALSLPSSAGIMATDPLDSSQTFYRTRSTTSSLRPQSQRNFNPNLSAYSHLCIYRRTDGVICKLTCLDCGRSNFSSAQGFLNHCRIAHSKEFTSQDAAALQCGEALPDQDQDEDGMSSINELKQKGLDPSKNLHVKEINFSELGNKSCPINNTTETNNGSDISSLIESTQLAINSELPKKRGAPFPIGTMNKLGKSASYLAKKFPESSKEELELLMKEVQVKPEQIPTLFDDEELDEEENLGGYTGSQSRATSADKDADLNRRKSRGGVALRSTNGELDEASKSPKKQQTLPKIKIKLDSNYEAQSAELVLPGDLSEKEFDSADNEHSPSERGRADQKDLTPAQRRRLPSNASPTRTRSRGLTRG